MLSDHYALFVFLYLSLLKTTRLHYKVFVQTSPLAYWVIIGV